MSSYQTWKMNKIPFLKKEKELRIKKCSIPANSFPLAPMCWCTQCQYDQMIIADFDTNIQQISQMINSNPSYFDINI